MTSGVANVRTYFYRGSLIDPPAGWLFNKKSGLLIFFESYKKSVSNNLKVYTHLFYTNHLGEPGGYKSSEKLNIDSAWKKWHELHRKGWTEVSHNYG